MLNSLFGAFGQTWRSVVAVVLAWGLIVYFAISDSQVVRLVGGFSRDTKEWVQEFFVNYVPYGNTVANFFEVGVSDAEITLTLFILFARVVVLALLIWFFKSVLEGIFGSQAR
ncbi:MAG: hypothetical protein GC199_10745 [Alphaproteobacteria bacterium]|nr:hypothetical protein [Alphaproteobacteria bacterium]